MALELGYILGAEPKLTAIVLNGFLQQNILFDAMAGKLPGYGVEFLEEITTICSMIGMLVLFFSPSLWKAKYLVSWIALFLIVTLGGATGFEFGYNLGLTSGQGILNMPLEAKSNKCTPEEAQANNGFCPLLGAGTKKYEEGIKDANGAGSATVASSVTQNNTTIDNKLTSNPDNTFANLSIYAFKPQVFILYLTNKLNAELKSALRGLSSIIMEEKTEVLNMVQNTMPGDPQINQWAQTFETVCKDKVLAKMPNTKFDHILSYTPEEAQALATALKDDKIQLRDAQKAVVIGNLLQKETKDNVPPLINLNVGPNGQSLVKAIEENGSKTDKDFVKYFTIHEDEVFFEGNQIYDLSDPVKVRGKLEDVIDLRDENDADKYMDSARKVKFDATSQLSNTDNVAITLVKANQPIIDRGLMRAPKDSLMLASNVNSEYMQFEDCGTLYEEMIKYNNESLNAFEQDLDKLIAKSGGLCGNMTNAPLNVINACKASFYGRAGAEFQAAKSILNLKDTLVKNCEGTPDECQKVSNDVTRLRNEFALTNSRRQTQSVINEANKNNNISDEGVTGFVADVTEAFTSEFAAAIVGLASIGESIKVGAYSAMLPIIKNILIGFILVLTPIFFLVGLLVPSWSLGVIITPLIALLFLQMTDVTMTIVGSVLDSVDRVLSTNIGYGRDENATYQAFMEMLSAMAYVSSFAITAFLMFAMGDTKTVMSKIAGMDKTIENTGMQIARTGAEMVAAVAKVGAGLATGGAMGGALGAKAAGAVAKTDALATIASEKGVKAAWDSLGTTSGNYAKLQKKHMENAYETITSEQDAIGSLKTTYDPTTGENVTKVTAKHNRESAIKAAVKNLESKRDNDKIQEIFSEDLDKATDKVHIENDKYSDDANTRFNKSGRLKRDQHAYATVIGKSTDKAIETSKKDHYVNSDKYNSFTSTSSVLGANGEQELVTTKFLSARDQIDKSLEHELRIQAGYVAEQGNLSDADWAKAKAGNKAAIKKASMLTTAYAQGAHKSMSNHNPGLDENGKMRQSFGEAAKMQQNIQDSLALMYAKQGMNKDDIANAVSNDMEKMNNVMSKLGSTDDAGDYSMGYTEEVKVKPGRKKK